MATKKTVSRAVAGAKGSRKGKGAATPTAPDSRVYCEQGNCPGCEIGEAARAPKAPTDQQYVQMAGSMHNALERLRVFYQTLLNLNPMGGLNGECILLHPSERKALLDEVAAAANILRSGLKARFRK